MSNATFTRGRVTHFFLAFILMPMLLFSQEEQAPERALRITKISASPPVLHAGGDAACSTITVSVSRTAGEPAPMVTLDLGVYAYDAPSRMNLSIFPSRTISLLINEPAQDYEYQVCAPPDTPPGSAVLFANIYSRPRDWTVKPSPEQTPFKFTNHTYTTADYVLLEVQE